ncbi:hypothetical protein IW147_005635 [Coemansia sp. RSA 720]|nr:hypothetical protein IW147_005635 [Coemansia sp. RSA 720]
MLAGGLELAAADVANDEAMDWAADAANNMAAKTATRICRCIMPRKLAAKVRALASTQSAGMDTSKF